MIQFDRYCDGISRRDMLHVGGLTALGLTVSDWIQLRTAAAAAPKANGSANDSANAPVAKSCILIWLDGGPSHLETFDLKPDAPQEVRGPFSPTNTNVPGIQICEHFERTAQLADKLAIVRSLTSPLGEHNFASHYLLTGYKPSPALVYPGLPTVSTSPQARQGLAPASMLPLNVAIQRPNLMSGPGYMGQSSTAYVVQGDPSKPDFQIKDLDSHDGLTSDRMSRRRSLRRTVDDFARNTEQSSVPRSSSFEQAYRLIASPQARAAFELSSEPASLRSRYGNHQLGQSCLMARRLIEAGSKFVTVTDRGWDTHENLFTRLREGYTGGSAGKIPKLDTAYAGLISDLADRGMLDSTLVILMGEFGRTPKLNPRGGRDHWPRAFSVVLAGGGIRGGQVIGKSDAHGERPADRPVSPADLAHTIYRALGIDPTQELHTPDGRPVQINRDGTLIKELLA